MHRSPADQYIPPVTSYVLSDPSCLEYAKGAVGDDATARAAPAPARKTLFWSLCDQSEDDLPTGSALVEALVKRHDMSADDLVTSLVHDAAQLDFHSSLCPTGVFAERAKTDLTKYRRKLQAVQLQMGQGKVAPAKEPVTPESHLTFLLEEAHWLAATLSTERAARGKLTRHTALGAAKYVHTASERLSKRREEESRRSRTQCKAIAQQVVSFWKVVELVVARRASQVLLKCYHERRLARQRAFVRDARKYARKIAMSLQAGGVAEEEESEQEDVSDGDWGLQEEEDADLDRELDESSSEENSEDEIEMLKKDLEEEVTRLPGVKVLRDIDKSAPSIKRIKGADGVKREPEEKKVHSALASTEVATASRVECPSIVQAQLRPYQLEGLQWLVALHDNNVNGILADEMGLGKTVQTIALLAHLAVKERIWGPHLVVVPTSVIYNWSAEFEKFLPGFKLLVYHGSKKERERKRQGWAAPFKFHVCITSYSIAVADASAFKRKPWYYLVLDEAHHIKNDQSLRWQTLLSFNSRRRLLLTGTPLQNSLGELWALMHFLMPQLFGSTTEWRELFSDPLSTAIEHANVKGEKPLIQSLHAILKPFLLRRLKRVVEKEMPMKLEHVLPCPLSKRQRALYNDFLHSKNARGVLDSGDYMGMMNVLMQLRKVCNHPDLLESRQVDLPTQVNELTIKATVPRDLCLWLSPNESADWTVSDCLGDKLDLSLHPLTSLITSAVRGDSTLAHVSARALLPGIRNLAPPDPFFSTTFDDPVGPAACPPSESYYWGEEGLYDVLGDPGDPSFGLPEAMLACAPEKSALEPCLSRMRAAGSWVHYQYVEWLRFQSEEDFVSSYFDVAPGKPYRHISEASHKQMLAQLSGGPVAYPSNRATPYPVAPLMGPGLVPPFVEMASKRMMRLAFPDSDARPDSYSLARQAVQPPTPPLHPIFGHGFLEKGPRHAQMAHTCLTPLHALPPTASVGATISDAPVNDWARKQQQLAAEDADNRRAERAELVLGGVLRDPTAMQAILHDTTPVVGGDLRRLVDMRQYFGHAKDLDSNSAESALNHSPLVKNLFPTPVESLERSAELSRLFTCIVNPRMSGRGPQISLSGPGVCHAKQQLAPVTDAITEASQVLGTSRDILFPSRVAIQDDCGKLTVLRALLVRLRSEGHKCLLFTQMSKMLDVLETFVNLHGFSYVRLDGSTKTEQRMKVVDRFNNNSRIFLFIASTRAGGIGLNLTAADAVIFYDSDWNPAMDRQAMDRAHRIGQTRDVHIYRLLSQHTIEENIFRTQLQKRLLDDVVVDAGNFDTVQSESFLARTSVSSLLTEPQYANVDSEAYFELYKTRVLHDNTHDEVEPVATTAEDALFEEVIAKIEDPEDHIALVASKKEKEAYIHTFTQDFADPTAPVKEDGYFPDAEENGAAFGQSVPLVPAWGILGEDRSCRKSRVKSTLEIDDKTTLDANPVVHFGVNWMETTDMSLGLEKKVDATLVRLMALDGTVSDLEADSKPGESDATVTSD